MNNYKSYKNEMELVKFFLEKAAVLEHMTLVAAQEMDVLFWLNYSFMMCS